MHFLDEIDFKSIENIEFKYDFDFCVLLGDIPPQAIEVITNSISKPILAVGGNHDTIDAYVGNKIIYLNGNLAYVGGLSIVGIDGSHQYKNLTNLIMQTHSTSKSIARELPKADILISHDSAYRIFGKDDNNCGLKGISSYIKRKKPVLHLHGHYHRHQRYRLHKTNCICTYRACLYKSDGTLLTLF